MGYWEAGWLNAWQNLQSPMLGTCFLEDGGTHDWEVCCDGSCQITMFATRKNNVDLLFSDKIFQEYVGVLLFHWLLLHPGFFEWRTDSQAVIAPSCSSISPSIYSIYVENPCDAPNLAPQRRFMICSRNSSYGWCTLLVFQQMFLWKYIHVQDCGAECLAIERRTTFKKRF